MFIFGSEKLKEHVGEIWKNAYRFPCGHVSITNHMFDPPYVKWQILAILKISFLAFLCKN